MGVSFSNLIPGLDTQSIISQLMSVEQQPLVALQQQEATNTTQQGILNQIQTDVTNLQQAVSQLSLTSTVGAKLVTTNTSSTLPSVVTGTASPDAANATYSVLVKQLATSTTVTSSSPDGGTTPAAIGQAVNLTAPIGSNGMATPITAGTFTINGVTLTVNANSVLDDPSNPSNSIVNMINSSGAGVTASISNDAYGRPNLLTLTSNSGKAIQLGSGSDTSNFLTAVGLSGAPVVGNTATSVTGNSVSAGALSATITVDGTAVTINQTNAGYTGAQNAAYIANALNAAGLDVTASTTGTNNDQIQLTQNTAGSQQSINLTLSGTNAAATGLTAGTYQNGTDAVTSVQPLSALDPTTSLSANSFATALAPDSSGGGSFTIDGTSITWSAQDSLNDIINRINTSGAAVRAAYDPYSDRVTLTSTQTGGSAISMQDVSGNLLQSLHLLSNATTSVAQTLGKNADVNIPGVNNGNDIVSPTNSLTGYIPGVTLNLQQSSSTPVDVTVGQDASTTVTAVQNFVNAANTLFGDIDKNTQIGSDPTQSGPLAGDAGLQGVEDTIKSLISSPVVGGSPGYQDLTSIGISTGAIGSAPGTTNSLQLDTNKLTQALQSNPQAVETLFAGMQASLGAVTQTSGTGNSITSATGTPTSGHQNGTWVVTIQDTSGNAQVQFNTSNGQTLYQQSGVLTANSTNNTLIPGVTLTTGSTIQPGTYQFSVNWNQVGSAVSLNDYLNGLLGANGLFTSRLQGISSEQTDLNNQIQNMQDSLNQRQQALQQQYSQLAAVLAQLSMQSGAVSAQANLLSTGSTSGYTPSSSTSPTGG